MSFWRDGFGDDQPPAAAGAWQRKDTGGCIGITGRVIVPEARICLSGPEQFPDPGDIGGTVAIPEEAVVADAMLPLGKDMDQEAADELAGLEGHGGMPPRTVDAVILDAEGDAPAVHADQAAVGDCNTVGVARQVCQHGLGSGERLLGINDPIDLAQRLQKRVKGRAIRKPGMTAEEVQLPGFVQPGQPVQDEAPVEAGQHPDGEEEVPAAGDPPRTVRRQAAARHDHVDMRVVRHRRTPGVQDGCGTGPGAKLLGIGGDPDHRVRARPHQQIVDLAFVLAGEVSDWLWQCEDQVEIPHGQQHGLARCQPSLGCTRLTLGAMAIAARVVGNVFMPAVFAPRGMATERCRAAARDGVHDFQLVEADMARIGRPPGRTMDPEDIRNLQLRPGQRSL